MTGMLEADETTAVAVCGGCGYPTLGPNLCHYCQVVTADPTAA
ncbi:hypothetical protein [Mycolicibacterium flavescens]|nr:hypothetical protein [Mycolicibacterium flavescens]